MRLTTVPFDRSRHIEPAASLLAERHGRDREREPRLPAAYEVPAACVKEIEHAFDTAGAEGAVALSGSEAVGFAIMTPVLIPPTHFLASFLPARGVGINYGSHAALAGMEHDVYRELYAALAERFVSLGFFDHGVNLPARDAAARDALSTLGFGQHMAMAIRGAGPAERPAADGVDLHLAGSEDAAVVYALSEELTLHHARSPIFNPYIRESDPAHHDMVRSLLEDATANAHWVAYEGGRAIGMNTFMQPAFLSPMTVPDEKTVYLFQGIVTGDARAGGVGTALLSRGAEWAREQGYEHIALHFATPNLSGARFWQTSGFEPVELGLRRRLDERIAWANR